MDLRQATFIANDVRFLLEPYCERPPAIAGSVRRKKATGIKDIEVVAIPKTTLDLFNKPDWENHQVRRFLAAQTTVAVSMNGPKHAKFTHRGAVVDLYLVTPPAQYGSVLAIRTGPADFSAWLVTKRQHGGAMPSHLTHRGHALWDRNGDLIPTPDEIDFFTALGLEWIAPLERRIPQAGAGPDIRIYDSVFPDLDGREVHK